MRHLLIILLMLLIPLQFAWSAAQSAHGHMGDDVPISGFHTHDGDHDHHDADELAAHDGFAAGDTNNGHNDDGHHCGHCHSVFSSLVIEPDLKLGEASPGGPPVHLFASFTSHIPLLFDRPPLARV